MRSVGQGHRALYPDLRGIRLLCNLHLFGWDAIVDFNVCLPVGTLEVGEIVIEIQRGSMDARPVIVGRFVPGILVDDLRRVSDQAGHIDELPFKGGHGWNRSEIENTALVLVRKHNLDAPLNLGIDPGFPGYSGHIGVNCHGNVVAELDPGDLISELIEPRPVLVVVVTPGERRGKRGSFQVAFLKLLFIRGIGICPEVVFLKSSGSLIGGGETMHFVQCSPGDRMAKRPDRKHRAGKRHEGRLGAVEAGCHAHADRLHVGCKRQVALIGARPVVRLPVSDEDFTPLVPGRDFFREESARVPDSPVVFHDAFVDAGHHIGIAPEPEPLHVGLSMPIHPSTLRIP